MSIMSKTEPTAQKDEYNTEPATLESYDIRDFQERDIILGSGAKSFDTNDHVFSVDWSRGYNFLSLICNIL